MEQGSLKLTLIWDGAHVVDAEVRSTAPAAQGALRGWSAQRVVDSVPRLYALCRNAQGAAARMCIEAARSSQPVSLADQGSAEPLVVEAILEHLGHFLVLWPQLLRDPARSRRADDFRLWRKRLLAARGLPTIAEVASDLSAWLIGLPVPATGHHAAASASAAVSLLPLMPAAQWRTQTCLAGVALPPLLAGQPAETGPLARHAAAAEVATLLAANRRVQARLVARRRELCRLAAALPNAGALACGDAVALAPGRALARVDTARGTLLHYAELAGECVTDYRIISPTDWNFHPQGACVRGLAGIPASSRAEAQHAAACLALSLDPCLPVSCEVRDA